MPLNAWGTKNTWNTWNGGEELAKSWRRAGEELAKMAAELEAKGKTVVGLEEQLAQLLGTPSQPARVPRRRPK